MTERELDAAVAKLCRVLGIWAYHTRISIGSQRGMPDWLLIGSKGVLFREDKSTAGQLTAEQRLVGYKLQGLGYDWDVWRPADLTSGRITRELEAIR